MSFSIFFEGIQEDFLLAVLPPVLCAVFRLAFVLVYAPEKSRRAGWRKWLECFRYGFWWGMDLNAYVFLALMVLVSIPAAFIPTYFSVSHTARVALLDVYCLALYLAFMGKMRFYYHFHDTFNQTVRLGANADKKNFADIFFHQNHGTLILLGIVPYLVLCSSLGLALTHVPKIPYLELASTSMQYALNAVVFVFAVLVFYWFRYGGTLRHRLKPEWDEVPQQVKDDEFMSKAVIDDLVALKLVFRQHVSEALQHNDAEATQIIAPLVPTEQQFDPREPWAMLRRTAHGALIKQPRHVFFLLGESHGQAPFDSFYDHLHLMAASKEFRAEPHTLALNNFMSAGMISQPSLTSLISGLYDADMELNENVDFWHGTLPLALPVQMKRLGYRTVFWYGGALTWGSLLHYLPAAGFDEYYGGPDFCPADSPRTWLGVYDHIFLGEAARKIKAEDTEKPTFHFLYTTSNHGPYLMPYEEYGFDADKVMPKIADRLRHDKKTWRRLAGIWYADQALIHFVREMREVYPDSLFIVSGDHTTGLLPFDYDIVPRDEANMRESLLTSFAMSHPELTPDMLAGNTIGGHMNILPTIMELVAPAGFEYYSLMPPLTESIDHVVTPYCWMTRDTIGDYRSGLAQQLAPAAGELPVERMTRFQAERDAWCELTSWMVRHPELLVSREAKP